MKQFVAQGHKEFQRRTAGLVIHSQKSHELEVIQDGEDDNDEVSILICSYNIFIYIAMISQSTIIYHNK